MTHGSSILFQLMKVDQNGLEALQFEHSILHLEELSVSDNRLIRFSVEKLPHLRTLSLDRNSLTSIEDADIHQNLEVVSWREQRLDSQSEIDYGACQDTRKIFLGGSKLETFAPNTNFLNLDTLELASCGLQDIPADLGDRCKNIRFLNLNFNAIQDVKPLAGIERLRSLYLAGNRLSRLRRTTRILKRIGSHISEIDLRNNPLTIGFYDPQSSSNRKDQKNQVVVHKTWPASDLSEVGKDTFHAHVFDEFQKDQDDLLGSLSTYIVPPQDEEVDHRFRNRLDEDTAIRRRVYDMLFMNACPTLAHLDGLTVDRVGVGKRDMIWGRLLELGVLRDTEAQR